MIRTVVILFLLVSAHFSNAQDVIETKTGDKILAKVIDIGKDEIKYKSHDNLMGSMHTINNENIVAITFANGTIKRFVPLPKPIDKMTQPEKFRINNGDKSVLWEYQFDTDSIFSGNTIFYYGLDMSHLVLINPDKENIDDLLRHYLPSWHEKFNDVITSELLKRGMRTTNVEMKNIKTQFTHEAVKEDWVKSNWSGLSIEEVITIVGEFGKTIEVQEGVGLLFIVDNYSKSKNKVNMITVFFDATTRSILWASKVEAVASDKDMVKHWGLGMVRTYHQFRLAVYEKGYKKYMKSKYANKEVK